MAVEKRFKVYKEDFANAGNVSSQIKQMVKDLKVDTMVLRHIVVACYEAEINMIIHSNGGEIVYRLHDKRGVLTLEFNDVGPGIPDVKKALTPGWSSASQKARQFGFGAGMGLANIIRVSDDFNLNTSEKGTSLKLHFNIK